MSVEPGVSPELGGTLRLRFAAQANPAVMVGTTFDLFEWHDTLDAGERFDAVDLPRGDFGWNLGDLYTTGEVSLTAAGLADYNANGFVDQGDLDLVLLNWGRVRPYCRWAGSMMCQTGWSARRSSMACS